MVIQAIVLGIVEGLTEFLPISSTGHLIVAEQAVGYKDTAELFTVVVQLGAIAAVAVYYWHDLWKKVFGLFRNKRLAKLFWLNLVIATMPAGFLGLLLDSVQTKFAKPLVVAIMLIAGGVVLWLVEEYHRPPKSAPPLNNQPNLDKVTKKQAWQIGLIQTISIVPGVSRSGASIVGGLLSGLDRRTATAFSFYLALPIMILASGLKLAKHHSQISDLPGGGGALLLAVAAAFITALLAMRWLLKYVSGHSFKPFAYYRIGFGLLILFLLATDLL